MLIFSSREVEGRSGLSAAEPQFAADVALNALNCPPQAPAEHWKVVQMNCDVDVADSMNELLPLFQQTRPLLLYLHGYNSTPAACFERCDRLQSLYGLEIVKFSWSARKHLRGDGLRPGFEAGVDPGLRRELARLFGAQKGAPSRKYPKPIDPVACDLENVTCAWWLLMALTGVRH
jgi:hypothetical protein